jgi:hypothetical protein
MSPSPRRTLARAAAVGALALAGAVATACAAPRRSPGVPQGVPLPRSGREVLQRMHDRYAGRWFRTLTFVQRTTMLRPDGTEAVETWYEAARAPDRLRIDRGDPAHGHGVLTTPDSTWVLRDGRVVQRVAHGNELIPFVMGVYTQPVDETLRDLAAVPIAMARVRQDRWQDRETWIVGAADASDTTSAQFWVDAERLVLVRLLVPGGPGAQAPVQDIRFDAYVPLGGSWLATRVAMYVAGRRVLFEEYSRYTADPPLPDATFDVARWREAPHWTRADASAPGRS